MEKEANLFKVLSDPTRLGLAVLLALEGETCVGRLAEALEVPGFKVSRHLGVMRGAGMVQVRRQGTWMFYRLAEPKMGLDGCLQQCLRATLGDHPALLKARRRLAEGA